MKKIGFPEFCNQTFECRQDAYFQTMEILNIKKVICNSSPTDYSGCQTEKAIQEKLKRLDPLALIDEVRPKILAVYNMISCELNFEVFSEVGEVGLANGVLKFPVGKSKLPDETWDNTLARAYKEIPGEICARINSLHYDDDKARVLEIISNLEDKIIGANLENEFAKYLQKDEFAKYLQKDVGQYQKEIIAGMKFISHATKIQKTTKYGSDTALKMALYYVGWHKANNSDLKDWHIYCDDKCFIFAAFMVYNYIEWKEPSCPQCGLTGMWGDNCYQCNSKMPPL